jgi:hypothetical protein
MAVTRHDYIIAFRENLGKWDRPPGGGPPVTDAEWEVIGWERIADGRQAWQCGVQVRSGRSAACPDEDRTPIRMITILRQGLAARIASAKLGRGTGASWRSAISLRYSC